jgi:chitinase
MPLLMGVYCHVRLSSGWLQPGQTIWKRRLGWVSQRLSIREFPTLKSSLRVDLDIEGGSSTGFAAFVTQIRSLSNGSSKQ